VRALHLDFDDGVHPLELGQLQARRIAPEIFEPVKGTLALVEDVNHDISEIDHHPLAYGIAIGGRWLHAVLQLQLIADFARDRFQMRLRGAGTDDEEIREIRDAAQINRDDVFRLFVGSVLGAQQRQFFSFYGVTPWV